MKNGYSPLCFFGLFLALVFLSWLGVIKLTLQELQLICFPIVLLILGNLGNYFERPPLWIFAAAIIFVGASFGFSKISLSNPNNGIFIAALGSDEFQVQTRIIRENLKQALTEIGRRPASISTLSKDITNSEEASAELERVAPSALALIWGGSDELEVEFGRQKEMSFGDEAEIWEKALSLQLVREIPGISASLREINSLAKGLNLVADLINSENSIEPLELKLREGELFETSAGVKPFDSYLLGNYYLRQALVGNSGKIGYLKCAIAALKAVSGTETKKTNPHLYAAAENNRAFALALRVALSVRDSEKIEKYELRIRKILRRAARSVYNNSAQISGSRRSTVSQIITDNFARYQKEDF